MNGVPDFIWPTVIEAGGIFRGWLAVAAAVKAFNAPHSISLSLFLTLELLDNDNEPSTRPEFSAHFSLCHLQLNTKLKRGFRDSVRVTFNHQALMEEDFFRTCSESR